MSRGRAASAAVLCFVWAGLAHAEPTRSDREQAKRYAAEGEALGTKNQFQAALEKFKLAASLDPTTPAYLCNVGLAHYAMNNFARAHLYLARCHEDNGGTWPAGVEDVYHFVEDALAKADYAPVDISVKPLAAHATVRISSLDDEGDLPTPIRVYLGIDHHQVTISAQGYVTKRVELVVNSKTTMTVPYELSLAPVVVVHHPVVAEHPNLLGQPIRPTGPSDHAASHRRTWGWITTGAGGVVGLVGIALVVKANQDCGATDFFSPTCSSDHNPAEVSKDQSRQAWGYGTALVGAAVAAAGLVIVFTAPHDEAEVSLAPTGDGAAASMSLHF